MNKQLTVQICFIALFLFILIQAIALLSPFFEPLFWAALLAFCFYPVHRYFLKKLRGRENWAAALTTLCAICFVAPLLALLFFKLTTQSVEFFERMFRFVSEDGLHRIIDSVRANPLAHRFELKARSLGFFDSSLHEWLAFQTKVWAKMALREIAILTRHIVVYSLSLFLMLIFFVAFLKYGQRIYDSLYEIAPLDERDKAVIFEQVRFGFSAVIRGQFLTGFAQSIIAGIVFWGLSIPMPVFLAAATFIASLVPVIGASAVWVPCAVYLFITEQFSRAVILTLMGIFGISLIDNFIKPAVIGNRIKLPYSLLFVAVLGGAKLYGFTGIFIAPIIFSLLFSLINIYRERFVRTSAR